MMLCSGESMSGTPSRSTRKPPNGSLPLAILRFELDEPRMRAADRIRSIESITELRFLARLIKEHDSNRKSSVKTQMFTWPWRSWTAKES